MRNHGKAAAAGFLTLAMIAASNGAGLAAQQAAGEAYGASVRTALTSATLPRAELGSGNYDDASAPSVAVAGMVRAANAFARTTGGGSTAESVATLERVDILDGVVTADVVMAIASSAFDGTIASSNADGSTFSNLRVAGTAIASGVAPNTRIDVPGVGTVILNERVPSGDGTGSTGLIVNMIRVVLKNALTGATTGDITVGSASSAVTSD